MLQHLFDVKVVHGGGVVEREQHLIVALRCAAPAQPDAVVAAVARHVLHHTSHVKPFARAEVAPKKRMHITPSTTPVTWR